MDESNAKLALLWRTRQGGGGKTHREYLDFIVNDQSLYDLFAPGDFIGCLGWGKADIEAKLIAGLMLYKPSELKTGRYMLYVCAECGDIGCGAVTVQIEKTKDAIIWKNFRFENDYDEFDSAYDAYKSIGPFRFNKTEYWQILNDRLSNLEVG